MSRLSLPLAAAGLALISALVACQPVDDCQDGSNCIALCSELDAEACGASDSCAPMQGKPLVEEGEDFCLDFEAEFEDLDCMPAETPCTDAEVFAVDPDGVGYYFSNGCIPADFEALAGSVGECAEGD
ncbi:MAG: hypothetical protein ACI9VR_002915 [Cognaticolwellia sp.]|jgi:hypothetical protein